jgi:hypothetical protein
MDGEPECAYADERREVGGGRGTRLRWSVRVREADETVAAGSL